jgi:YafQ family addiction module toxin component
MFEFDFSDEFRRIFKKLSKKDPVIAKAINRKIKEIISRDPKSVMAYKNLSHGFKNLKRIHITEWLVITFEVDLNHNLILFVKIASRDEAYKR